MKDQIDKLRLLQNGWLDGDGLSPCHDLLDWLEDAAEAWPVPRIYPTFEGGVLLEWLFGRNDVSLEINREMTGHWHNYNLDNYECDYREFDFENKLVLSWLWVAEQLRLLKDAHGDPR